MSITENMFLKWNFLMKKKFKKIQMIFDVSTKLTLKVKVFHFLTPYPTTPILKVQ